MIVIYNFIATSVLGIPLEKVYGLITYSIVESIDNTLEYVINPYTFSKGIPKTEVAIKL